MIFTSSCEIQHNFLHHENLYLWCKPSLSCYNNQAVTIEWSFVYIIILKINNYVFRKIMGYGCGAV